MEEDYTNQAFDSIEMRSKLDDLNAEIVYWRSNVKKSSNCVIFGID
jgi:hypothetical protein